tara:strand:- start:2970 stop:3602 length:633 start_codon:yes stop_codon:yes gene_type:complete
MIFLKNKNWVCLFTFILSIVSTNVMGSDHLYDRDAEAGKWRQHYRQLLDQHKPNVQKARDVAFFRYLKKLRNEKKEMPVSLSEIPVFDVIQRFHKDFEEYAKARLMLDHESSNSKDPGVFVDIARKHGHTMLKDRKLMEEMKKGLKTELSLHYYRKISDVINKKYKFAPGSAERLQNDDFIQHLDKEASKSFDRIHIFLENQGDVYQQMR